ncbi:MAG TPA: hypothetical protein VHF22_06840 [Planctomycetota bacterium]|jgi:hypothetical protein|nr:hypothetical protein [Planctomycetota bacterium]
MLKVHCGLDGTAAAEAKAREAIAAAAARNEGIALVGEVREPRFGVPQPAIGDRIRRFQRVESQLLRLAREAEAAGVDVKLALPGHDPVPAGERAAMRPAAA